MTAAANVAETVVGDHISVHIPNTTSQLSAIPDLPGFREHANLFSVLDVNSWTDIDIPIVTQIQIEVVVSAAWVVRSVVTASTRTIVHGVIATILVAGTQSCL